ncbi:MAG: aspartate:alanine exchanger family transporter [Polyangiales bacterium]
MRALLRDNPLLLLFLVAALGFVLGRVRVRGVAPGVAAVLSVGLAASAWDPALRLPEIVPQLGLALFVYTLGLSSGPGFFASFRTRGLRDAGAAFGMVAVGAALTVALAKALGLSAPVAAGLFSGALTNTPALAGVIQQLRESGARDAALDAPVVGYSVAYPGGVIGVILVLAYLARRKGAESTASTPPAERAIVSRTARVTRDEAVGSPAEALARHHRWNVILARLHRDGHTRLVDDLCVLRRGDLVTVVGHPADVERAVAFVGEPSPEALELDRSEVDYRRVFVSNPAVVGRPLRELGLAERLGAVVTRVRRGDVELLADDEFTLELGDRVRVVAPRAQMADVSRFFGDSFRALGEVDVLTFGLGIALGLALGAVPFPAPGGSFRLGAAGGPLVVGLLLGRVGRTGTLVWSIPFGANLTLRQLGVVLFLAGVGTRAGAAFAEAVRSGAALTGVAAGLAVTVTVAAGAGLAGARMGLPTPVLLGAVAGVQTQPAALAFACEQAGERPNEGYTAVFPVAMIAKILLAQAVVLALGR